MVRSAPASTAWCMRQLPRRSRLSAVAACGHRCAAAERSCCFRAIAVPTPISGPSEYRADDGLRLTPPADIPSRPLDLRAKQGRSSVTEDVMSAAKSVFHAVVPESSN